jgi:mannosyltransferase OCH1-like enzyme
MNIIQTYSNFESISETNKSFIQKIKSLHPEWNYMFFSDTDILKFITEETPEYYDTFSKFKFKIQQIDFFRYLAIYQYGGLYLDVDMEITAKFTNFDESKSYFPVEFQVNNHRDVFLQNQNFNKTLGNFAFYAPAKSPFIKKIIDNIVTQRIDDTIIENAKQFYERPTTTECINENECCRVYYTTGPILVTQSYLDLVSPLRKEHVVLLESTPFVPFSFGNFGTHKMNSVWKQKSNNTIIKTPAKNPKTGQTNGEISKILLQLSSVRPPLAIQRLIAEKFANWDYRVFTDAECIAYIQNNPIDNFTESVEIYKALKEPHRSDFFKYYFLYLNGGVYMNNDSMIDVDIGDITKEYSFFAVESILNNNTVFSGFIGSHANSDIMFQILNFIYETDKTVLESDYFIIQKKIYSIIADFLKNTSSQPHLAKHKIYKESFKNPEYAIILEEKRVIFTHYYNSTILPKHSPPAAKKEKSKLKIGITTHIADKFIDMFNSGIKQNVVFLNELFLNIGYDSYFIVRDETIVNNEDQKRILYDNRFKIIKHTDILCSELDIVFVMGYDVEVEILKKLKHQGVKLVAYCCGNSYIIESEQILYNLKQIGFTKRYNDSTREALYDAVWSIPQMYNTNKYYWETIYRCPCIEAPFVWSDKILRLSDPTDENRYLYKPKPGEKSVVVFEPNLSIMKSCIPPLLICENAYRWIQKTKHANMKKVFLNNVIDSKKHFDLDAMNEFSKQLDLFHDGKLSIEGRFNAIQFIDMHADIVVSHQWENNLNYLYLDMAWMGWPIVHNGSLCKDVGYYYDGFNYQAGSEALIDVIANHDSRVEQYIKDNRRAITRYLPNNQELMANYEKMIDNL